MNYYVETEITQATGLLLPSIDKHAQVATNNLAQADEINKQAARDEYSRGGGRAVRSDMKNVPGNMSPGSIVPLASGQPLPVACCFQIRFFLFHADGQLHGSN